MALFRTSGARTSGARTPVAQIPAAIALMAGAVFCHAACDAPQQPEIPDGSSASMEQMVAGQKAFKGFQADLVGYRACLDEALAALEQKASDGDEDARASFEAMTADYNASVVAEEKMAADFNGAIRAYKAANPN